MRTRSSRRFAALSCLATLALTGCTQYGARTYSADVRSDPSGLRAYAIPHDVWVRNGGEKMLQKRESLASFRISGYTPADDVVLRAQRYVFLAERDGRFEVVERTIDRDNLQIAIEFEPTSGGQ